MKRLPTSGKPDEDIVQRIAGIAVLRTPLWRLERWFHRRFKIGTYELNGEFIVAGRGNRPGSCVRIEDVRSWRIQAEMGFDLVTMELADGRVLNWIDEYDDLIEILRRVAPDKERAWRFA